MRSESELRATIVEIGRLLFERDLVGATEGNITCRLDNDLILTTPSGLCKGRLKPEDMVVVDMLGQSSNDQQPSSELPLHLRAYAVRMDVEAVIHAHPLTATGFALAHRPIPSGLLPEAVVVLGDIPLVPFGMPGTESLPDEAEPFLRTSKTLLLANHGALALGSSLWDALWRMETLERVARIALTAEMLGGATPLPAEAVSYLEKLGQS